MARPAVFIHGLWLHATSWRPWLDLFAQRGYDPVAPGWPRRAGDRRARPGRSPTPWPGLGIEDVTDHYAGVIAGLPEPPVIIGHSFGGLIAQKLLGRNLGAAAVAIDPAQIRGVLVLPPAQLRASGAVLGNPANAKRSREPLRRPVPLRLRQRTEPRTSPTCCTRSGRSRRPGEPLFEAATANFVSHSPAAVDTRNARRGPLLLVSGGKDHTVPDSVTRSTFKQYRHSTAVTELKQFPDRGHSLIIDNGWREVADAALAWLDKSL